MDEFLTTEELLAELKISRSTLYRLLGSGQLAAQRIGETGTLRFKRGDVAALLRPWQAPVTRGNLPVRGMVKFG